MKRFLRIYVEALTFSEKHADFFMSKLAECIGRPIEQEDGDSHANV